MSTTLPEINTIPNHHICEIHVKGGVLLGTPRIRPLLEFLADWRRAGGFKAGDWIAHDRGYFGVIHEHGAYLVSANGDSHAARLAAEVLQ